MHKSLEELRPRKMTAINAKCAQCHTAVWASFQRPYKHKLPEGAMSCVDCHNPHGTQLPRSIQTVSANEPGCFRCHGDKRGQVGDGADVGVRGTELAQQHLRVAHHRGQRLVQLVRGRARQLHRHRLLLGDGELFLRGGEPLLHVQALAQIREDADGRDLAPFVVEHQRGGDLHGNLLAIGGAASRTAVVSQVESKSSGTIRYSIGMRYVTTKGAVTCLDSLFTIFAPGNLATMFAATSLFVPLIQLAVYPQRPPEPFYRFEPFTFPSPHTVYAALFCGVLAVLTIPTMNATAPTGRLT
jgi:predicted CXXCH cytochrome family protein